ncbi:MAG: hypothetical protein K8U57_05885 [Planctomycetes bacterium]|nr:hypothetical protein [Planctomycetota bacterium]
MRWILFSLAVAVLLTLSQSGQSQPGPTPGQSIPGGRPGAGGVLDTGVPKICVVEFKKTTKVVHGSDRKDYCRPRSIVLDAIRSCFGLGSGCKECKECGDLKTFHVLTKKTVPGPEVPVCVVKDLSALHTVSSTAAGAAVTP